MIRKGVSIAVLVVWGVAAIALAGGTDAINAKYKDIGATSLGKPAGPEKKAAGGGIVRMYSKGAIYWSNDSGTHAIYGPAFTKYKSLGAEKGALGYPVTDLTLTDKGSQIVLQHGVIDVSKSGKATVRKWPSVTFTEAGATLKEGNAKMTSSTDAFFAPISPAFGPDTTITCGCKVARGRVALGNCTVTLTGNTVTCTQGTCSGTCQITITN
jgi:hypothetical protein